MADLFRPADGGERGRRMSEKRNSEPNGIKKQLRGKYARKNGKNRGLREG